MLVIGPDTTGVKDLLSGVLFLSDCINQMCCHNDFVIFLHSILVLQSGFIELKVLFSSLSYHF
jgi:hypothetical protein